MYVAQAHVYGTRVRVALVCACGQDMTRAHVKIKCQEKNGTFQVYYPPAIMCCFCVFLCKQCIRILTVYYRMCLYVLYVTGMYWYVLVCYSYVTRMLLVCYSYVTRMYSYAIRMYSYVTRMYSCGARF